jgi:5'-3' exonuclease
MSFNLFNPTEQVTLVDFSGIVYRSQYSQQAASISTFVGDQAAGPTVILLGSVMKLVKDFTNPIFVIDGWPKGKYKIYPKYKFSRKVEKEKDPQNEVKRAVRNSLKNSLLQYIPSVNAYHPDEEADDSIASLAVQLKAKGVKVCIVSADRDLWQLLDDGIRIFAPSNEGGYFEVTPEKVLDTFGCPKEKIALYKTWLGDAGDDVPKIFRLPTKLALTLINASDDVEDSLVKIPYIINDPKHSKWKSAMLEFADQARINWELVNAKRDLEVGFAYFRSDPNILQSLLDAYQVQGFTAQELHHTMIPHQENALQILNKHGFLGKVWKFEEIYSAS